MPLCHGKGDPSIDGCCWVEGQVCPLRLKIDGGSVYDHAGTNLGTPQQFVSAAFKKPQQAAALAQLQGVRIVCRAALESIAANTALLTDRPALNTAWNTHADYVARVRPAWERIEQRLGLAPGSYQCSEWKGTRAAQCCFAESAATNDAGAATLSTDARTVRQAGGT